MIVQKYWATLPNLHLVFWNESSMKAIGNKLGRFNDLEEGWELKEDMHWVWVHVEVDLWEGLVGKLNLIYIENSWNQRVDY